MILSGKMDKNINQIRQTRQDQNAINRPEMNAKHHYAQH